MSDYYNFHDSKNWTGRITTFSKSIDSNLKLLRVILLTKGSTIMEFSKLMGKGLLKLNDTGLPKDFKDNMKSIDNLNDVANGYLKQSTENLILANEKAPNNKFLERTQNAIGNFFQGFNHGRKNRKKDKPAQISKGNGDGANDEDVYIELLPFEFEETQLYNLRTLSLNQKTFVEGKLKLSVESALKNANSDVIAQIRNCFQYIATDIEIVQRAIVQRVHEVDDEGNYVPSMQASALQTADMLALLSLKPFSQLLPESAITPITFFSQETHIRSLPYCENVVLIGIRYDQVLHNLEADETPPPFEMLAIPHEIGHYVFQRANLETRRNDIIKIVSEIYKDEDWDFTNDPIDDSGGLTFQDLSDSLPLSIENQKHRDWCEEIFSDICGCIVAGPLVALSLLSILTSRSDNDNQQEEGEHPTGSLRPYILKAILDELYPNTESESSVSKDIIDTWENSSDLKPNNKDSQLTSIKKIISVFSRILIGENETRTHAIWSSAHFTNLKECVDELKSIKTLSGFTELEPAHLTKIAPEAAVEMDSLLSDWIKKGPVTIGDHD